MAVDKKISGLTGVTTPAATDEFPCIQGGVAPTLSQTRAQIHALESGEHLVLPQVDEPLTPTLAFDAVGFYEPFSGTLRLSRSGIVAWEFSSIFGRNANLGAVFRGVDSSATVPNILPANSDLGTGTGRAGPSQLSLIANFIEGLRVNTIASGVNFLNITPSAAASPVLIGAEGTDADIDIQLVPKGTGGITRGGNHLLEGYATGRSIIRSVLLQITPGATPGTNISVSDIGALNRSFNTPTIVDGTNIAKSGSNGDFALDASGTIITMDVTEDVVGIISYSFRRHDINSSSTTEMYILDPIVTGGNLTIGISKRGSGAGVDWTTIMDAGDGADIFIAFVTSS